MLAFRRQGEDRTQRIVPRVNSSIFVFAPSDRVTLRKVARQNFRETLVRVAKAVVQIGRKRLQIGNPLSVERDEPRVAGRSDDKKRQNQTDGDDNASGNCENALKFHVRAAGPSIVFK